MRIINAGKRQIMDDRDTRGRPRDYFLHQRIFDTLCPPDEPPRLSPSPYDIGRGVLKWTAIAVASWVVISGGMYIGWTVLRASILGPDLW